MEAADSVRGGVTPAVAVVDGAGTVIGWTQAAEELTGYPAADILGRPIGSLLPPDGHDRDGERSGAHLPRTGLMEVRRRDGEVVIVRAEAVPLTLGDDVGSRQESWLVSAIPAAIDLSTGTGALLESLISSFPVAMAIWDKDLRCVWFNEAAEQLSDGYPYYRIGRSLTEVIAGIDTEAVQDAMREVLADSRPTIDREARWFHGSQERALSISLLPLEGADGRPLGVCSVALDFSNSKARDHLDLLREASVRLGSTLDVMKTAQELAELAIPVVADYVTVDLPEAMLPGTEPLQRRAATSSPVFRLAGAASVHEGAPESLWERKETVFVPPRSPFTEVLHSRRPHFEPVLDTSPGAWLDLDPDRARIIHATGMHSLIVIPLQARDDVLGVATFARTSNPAPFTRDDLLLAEELVTRAALSLDNARQYTIVNHNLELLEAAVQRERRFTSDASHDLRTPITGARLRLEEALMDPDAVDWPRMAKDLLNDVERQQAIAEDILILARLDADRPAQRQRTDLAELVRAELQRRTPGRVPIRTDLAPGVFVSGDRLLLSRLLTNLLNNAQRHAATGVTVVVRAEDDTAVLMVLDDGAGIAPDHRELIFERFARLPESRARDPKGTGLGLAISREIAHAHQGTLTVEDPGQGTCLVLRMSRLA
ncbi:PAS domain-containing sensor histidine kinase [Streptosporangium sp. 'caverna']|uniref:PAS domain-containing sensor histidine kinase n=1 Tax=Streptosporangium sp. 'caverna' TaxID=2202249 RepID=UPI0013A6F7F8|nr:ATP-binding protein [Streptosporangium sp. 'caverna']